MKFLLPFLFLLAACAGRAEREIKPTRGYDDNLTCAQITLFHRNNENLVDKKLRERQNTRERNVAVSVTAVIFFTPLLLATDLRDVEKNEILGLKRRNEVLRDLARGHCPMPPIRHEALYAALEK
jgi:hypothetical protein